MCDSEQAAVSPGADVPTIFIVDDDEGVRGALELLMDLRGWRPRSYASARMFLLDFRAEAETQRSAAPIASHRGRACLILDLDMPDMNGAELLENLYGLSRAPPAIVVTADDGAPLARRALAAGALAVVAKPFGNTHLIGLVERALDAGREDTR